MLNLQEINYGKEEEALEIALILAIVVWTKEYIEYRKLVKQRKINGLIKKIREKEKKRGNEKEGETKELATRRNRGNLRLWEVRGL
uniref:Protein Vpu n=1 Tax=Human immunodeficiency virus type 1 TaxID=11676 RepID=A0A286LH86_HV1|nr:vpu protein [Human immunodeficiency virus 1]